MAAAANLQRSWFLGLLAAVCGYQLMEMARRGHFDPAVKGQITEYARRPKLRPNGRAHIFANVDGVQLLYAWRAGPGQRPNQTAWA